MPWWVKTPPAIEPITLAEAKAHLRVDGTDDDAYITALITAARERIEDYLDRALIQQTLVYTRDRWPQGNEIALPGGKVLSVVSITYKDTAGIEHPFTGYLADTESVPGRIVLAYGASWPGDALHPLNPVRIEYTAGYGSAAANVPQKIKQAILLLIGHLYEHREEITADKLERLPFGVTALVEREKVYWVESR